jgi:hypothetical protein
MPSVTTTQYRSCSANAPDRSQARSEKSKMMSRPGGPERLASGSDASASPASSSSRLMASMSGASMLAASG